MYDPNDFASGDPVNQALTAGAAALYGVTHAVVSALGFIPSLGIIHTGIDRSFVYDIADLYKAEISIPAAFEAVSQNPMTAGQQVRRLIRDRIVETRLLPRMVKDLQTLMEVPDEDFYSDVQLRLWSELEVIAAGVNWDHEEA